MPELKVLKEEQGEAYDNFLCKLECGWFYYSFKYKIFLEKLLNARSEYWIAEENNEIVGVLPLMFLDGKFGRVFNSLPFYGSNGGILTEREDVYEMLLEKYRSVISNDGTAASNYISNPLLKPTDANIPFDIIDERIAQLTPINYTENVEESLMNSFHYKVRNTIRKANKEITSIKIVNDSFEFLEQTHIENMAAIGGKAKSSDFFKLIPNVFEADKDYRIYVAFNDKNEMMAAMLLFYFNNTVEYFTPVIKQEFRNSQPLTALIFKAMMDAASRGFKWWNWGATWKSQDGVYLFKSRWNTKDILYKYYIFIKNKAIFKSTKEELLREYSNFYVIPFSSLQS